MLLDLQTLNEKHNILAAGVLYNTVQAEAEVLCIKLDESIMRKIALREKYEQKKETVHAL